MPYLNWKTATLGQDVGSDPEREFRLELKLDHTLVQELAAHLEDVMVPGGAELRVDLPREWICFWKPRDGESRLLMAHPIPDAWVATAALEVSHGKKFVDGLRALSSGGTLSVARLGAVDSVSNVEILITLN